MPKFSEQDIQTHMVNVEEWALQDESIQKVFTHKDFVEAMRFVNTVADLAEKVHHHPDILINWNKVTLTLSTHSEGGLTDKDFNLAKQIDQG